MVTTSIHPFSAGVGKIVALGSAGCGKTSLVQRFLTVTRYIDNTFQHEYVQTFGAEMFEKSATDPKKWSLQIWTVGGAERYRTLLSQFYAGVRVALLCFDTTNQNSFQELSFWYNETKRNCPDASLILVGMKGEEGESSTAVKPSDILKLSKEWGVECKITNAKNGTQVDDLFEFVASKLN